MVHGAWRIVYPWSMAHFLSMVHGHPRSMIPGPWTIHGPWSILHPWCMVDACFMFHVLSMIQDEDAKMWRLSSFFFFSCFRIVFGRFFLLHAPWFMVHACSMGHPWSMVHGALSIHGPWPIFSPWSMAIHDQ